VEEDTIQAETEWAVRRKRYRLRLSGPCAREKIREQAGKGRREGSPDRREKGEQAGLAKEEREGEM
jgi:hypothetical protein